MSERETKKILTPNGVEVEIKTYLTGGEARQIQEIMLKGADIDVSSPSSKEGLRVKSIKAESLMESERKTVEISVVSINGVKDNLLQRLSDLPIKDYQFVSAEVQKLTQDFLAEGNR